MRRLRWNAFVRSGCNKLKWVEAVLFEYAPLAFLAICRSLVNMIHEVGLLPINPRNLLQNTVVDYVAFPAEKSLDTCRMQRSK